MESEGMMEWGPNFKSSNLSKWVTLFYEVEEISPSLKKCKKELVIVP